VPADLTRRVAATEIEAGSGQLGHPTRETDGHRVAAATSSARRGRRLTHCWCRALPNWSYGDRPWWAIEMQQTRPCEFGDSVTHTDVPATFTNALLRAGPGPPVRLKAEYIVIHKTRNTPGCASAVLLDMGGPVRYDEQHVNVKRVGLALEGLVRGECPGDSLRLIEVCTLARPRRVSEVAALMYKPATLFDSWVRKKVNRSDPRVGEVQVTPHFTNTRHGLQLASKFLAAQGTPDRQVMLITDGLPTAHFEGGWPDLLYPPGPRTKGATLREARPCAREGITINIFLLASWDQTPEDVLFAYKVAESTKGRVFLTAGRQPDRYAVWG
jgi:uncharacterized protein with von Willebrand factor type A (vWA) domain